VLLMFAPNFDFSYDQPHISMDIDVFYDHPLSNSTAKRPSFVFNIIYNVNNGHRTEWSPNYWSAITRVMNKI